jgi:ABC-type sugar transport system ATPase subunit
LRKALLEMKNITKVFPGVVALDNVSFEAHTGEIIAIVGENGAGKSTLMKILSGSYPANSFEGQIFVNEKEMNFINPAQSELNGIAMIYQEIPIHLNLTVAENLCVGHWPKKKNGAVDWQKLNSNARAQLKLMDLDIVPSASAGSLNTSQLQIISIVRALSKNPLILVLDEPTSALTQLESGKLFVLIKKLKEKGITSLLITHKLEEVFENSDRVIVIRDGKVINSHITAETDQNTIIAEMVGREFKTFFPDRESVIGDVLLRVENYTVPHPFVPNKNIVENISFEVHAGEILGLAGLVGAGRSELVNAIYGKHKKLSGNLYFKNKLVKINTPQDAIKYGIALVTEDRKVDGFVGKLDVKNNITLASLWKISSCSRLQHKKEKDYASSYFKRFDIRAPSLNTLLDTLSGGNQQKVVLSKCLMTDPNILILDEPTKGIDVASKHAIYEIMATLVKKGIAIILISSELPELISMSDRIMVLSAGCKTGELSGEEISQVEIMRLATIYS